MPALAWKMILKRFPALDNRYYGYQGRLGEMCLALLDFSLQMRLFRCLNVSSGITFLGFV